MSKFNWPFEISGLGGGYEQACRDMAEAGAEWLAKHPGIVQEWVRAEEEYMKRTGEDYFPMSERPQSYREFNQAVQSACESSTGAMLGEAKGHAIIIAERGWAGYCKFVLSARQQGGEMNTTDKKCETCKWAWQDKAALRCHRHSPRIMDKNSSAIFPLVEPDCFCDEYNPKSISKEAK